MGLVQWATETRRGFDGLVRLSTARSFYDSVSEFLAFPRSRRYNQAQGSV